MSMVPLLATMQNTSIFDPASPPAESIRNVALLTLAVTGFIFVIVETVLLYCLLRFRRSPAAGTAEPPQVYGSKPIEIAWSELRWARRRRWNSRNGRSVGVVDTR